MNALLRRVPASFWALALLVILCALFVPRFASLGNAENVLRVAAILALAASGQAIVLIIGGIDFSIGSAVALASVATVLAMPELGTVGGLAAGAGVAVAIGAANGALVAGFSLPAFLVTLGMLMAVHGVAAVLSGGLPLDAPPSDLLSWPARGVVLGMPVPVAGAALALLVLHVVLRHTVLGRSWFLIGANPVAARFAGIPVRRATFLAYLAGGVFVAAAAVVLTSRVASGQPNLHPGLPFEAIAACAVGGIPLAGGRGSAAQVAIGALIIAILNNVGVLLNFPAAWQLLLIGGVIVGAVLLQHERLPFLRAVRS